jgi:dihydrodipicolinate synthase/N-acetylneuraminate lyase
LNNLKKNIEGIILPVPSYYKDNLNLDFDKLKKFLEFQIARNIKIFYLASTASEFEFMSENERIEMTRFIASTIGKDHVLLRSYSPERHDRFYINYINHIAKIVKSPIIFHDQPFGNGIGLSSHAIKEISKNKFIDGFKLHTQDLNHLKNQYQNLKKKMCFDGFGKTTQFWTLQWGAKAMHSCWSWFEPESDLKFFQLMKKRKFKEALKIINRETPIIDAIRSSGFPGYKELMRLVGLPHTKSRIPGETLSQKNRNIINKAFREIKKTKIN